MILLNITFGADKSLVSELKSFILDTLIPAAENDGFHSFIFSKITPHEEGGDEDSLSYAVQMRAPGEKEYKEFTTHTAPAVFEIMARRWGKRVMYFATRLDILHDSNRDR